MRYRKLSSTGDYMFGHGRSDFLVDSAAAVAQAMATRLKLAMGEWFLDTTDGTPWYQQILGRGTANTRDLALRERILGTPGVLGFEDYSSNLDAVVRQFSVRATVNTQFGLATVVATASSTSAGTLSFEISGYGEGGYGREGYGR